MQVESLAVGSWITRLMEESYSLGQPWDHLQSTSAMMVLWWLVSNLEDAYVMAGQGKHQSAKVYIFPNAPFVRLQSMSRHPRHLDSMYVCVINCPGVCGHYQDVLGGSRHSQTSVLHSRMSHIQFDSPVHVPVPCSIHRHWQFLQHNQ